MSSLDAALRTYEVLTALHALPDRAALTTAEAALFLRLSPKTMERMRVGGGGPPYVQAGVKSSRGVNQKCFYMKADLLAWQHANQVSDAMAAAVRKGHAFRTIFDLIVEAPFYVDADERIAGTVEDEPLSVVIERLGSDVWDILWLPFVEAAGRQWASLSAHREFGRAMLAVLANAEQRVIVAIEATNLGSGISGRA